MNFLVRYYTVIYIITYTKLIMALIFSIEGNIGSGKSTLVNLLKQYIPSICDKDIIYLQEPVNVWNEIKDKQGISILEKFYADQSKYAFSFQMMAYISRLHLIKQAVLNHPNSIIITERCVFTDREIFAKMLYDNGNIEEINYKIYLQWFDEFIKDVPITGFIYVKTTPEKSKTRVDFRARQGENIPLPYLQKCHLYHEKWFISINRINKIVLDGNIEFKSGFPSDWLPNIVKFIKYFIVSNVATTYHHNVHYC